MFYFIFLYKTNTPKITIGVYIVRLTSEEFTALDDISMDSYVENAFLVAVASNVLVKKL